MLNLLRQKMADSIAPPTEQKQSVTMEQLVDLLNLGGIPKSKLSEATYFTCIKILSESMGKLPLKLQQKNIQNGVREAVEHPLYSVLRFRPNPYMTSSTFWSTVELNRNHYGNAFCLVTGVLSQTKLWILPSKDVEIWYDDRHIISDASRIWYLYNCKGKTYKFCSDEILHFKTPISLDGITGLSVGEILKTTLEGNQKAQKMLNSLYDNGFTGKVVMQYTSELSDKLAETFKQKIADFASGKDKIHGDIIPIPLGTTLQPLNVKLTDAEFLGLKKYSALQIAAAFGIKPNQINDYEKSSYASAEAQQLAFYVDTLLFPLKQYEEEIAYKLLRPEEINDGYSVKFNISVILRADIKTQIDTLSRAVSNFIYTPNEARAFLDMESKPNGDKLIGNGSTIPIDKVGCQYDKNKRK